jgi:hypothetical protein
VILRRAPIRVVDLMEMKEFLPPWLGWRRKQEREGLLECLRSGRRGGGHWVRWRGRWDPTGARVVASLRVRHAGNGTHGPSAREVRTVRPFQTETSFLSLNSKLDLPSLQKFHKNLC